MGNALPPARSISSAAVKMVPGSLELVSVVLAAMAILAPSRAAFSAMARPMPRLAPVMNRVFPRSDMGEPFYTVPSYSRSGGCGLAGPQGPARLAHQAGRSHVRQEHQYPLRHCRHDISLADRGPDHHQCRFGLL